LWIIIFITSEKGHTIRQSELWRKLVRKYVSKNLSGFLWARVSNAVLIQRSVLFSFLKKLMKILKSVKREVIEEKTIQQWQ